MYRYVPSAGKELVRKQFLIPEIRSVELRQQLHLLGTCVQNGDNHLRFWV